MKKDEAIKQINSRLEHEHGRWNTWALFFFGSIVSTFTLWNFFKDSIPSFIPFIFSAILSVFWLTVAIGIRRVTICWRFVLRKIEVRNLEDEFILSKMFKCEEESYRIWKDHFRDKGKWKFNIFRVTKVLIYLGFFSFTISSAGALYFIFNPYKDNQIEIDPHKILVEIHRSIEENSLKIDSLNSLIQTLQLQSSGQNLENTDKELRNELNKQKKLIQTLKEKVKQIENSK